MKPEPLPFSASTHVRNGKPTMVDITMKLETQRTAVALVDLLFSSQLVAAMDDHELQSPKGPVFQTAIIAGTMAVKKTSELIPFCHPLAIENCKFEIVPSESGISIRCEVSILGRTGVEMEAMTGASIAALTIYDMCKGMDKSIRINNLRLISKTGGKSGDYRLKDA